MRVLAIWALLPLAVLAASPTAPGVHNFTEVDEHIYRGGQPTVEGLKSLAKLGVKTVIDLRASEQLDEKKQVEALGMKYLHFSMPALSAPPDERVAEVLKVLEDPTASTNWPVFIHCMRGKDRTGLIVACYRIKHQGWDNQKALEEAKQHGLSRLEWRMQQYIRDYKPANATPPPALGAKPPVK